MRTLLCCGILLVAPCTEAQRTLDISGRVHYGDSGAEHGHITVTNTCGDTLETVAFPSGRFIYSLHPRSPTCSTSPSPAASPRRW